MLPAGKLSHLSGHDWSQYDHFVLYGNRRGQPVVYQGDWVGELHPFAGETLLRCAVLCKIHTRGKARSSRMRSWQCFAGEDVLMVDRVLVKWLIDGSHPGTTTETHLALERQ